jgi:hypothetical protein
LVCQSPREAVGIVNEKNIDRACLDRLSQLLQRWPFQARPSVSVIDVLNPDPDGIVFPGRHSAQIGELCG